MSDTWDDNKSLALFLSTFTIPNCSELMYWDIFNYRQYWTISWTKVADPRFT